MNRCFSRAQDGIESDIGHLGIVFMAICSLASGCHGQGNEQPAIPDVQAPKRGELVIVEVNAAQFLAGRVMARQGETLRVQAIGDGTAINAPISEVYRVPGGIQTMRLGELAICDLGSNRWTGCRVEAIKKRTFQVSDAAGNRFEVAVASVLVPSELTVLNLEHYFSRAAERARFAREIEQALPPRAPSQWRPRIGARVLALINAHWYSATVRELAAERAGVSWQADARITELPRSELVPEPPYEVLVRRGAYALARPTSPLDPWEAVRVEAIVSSEHWLVRNVNGEKRMVATSGLVPLGQSH